MKSDSRRSFVKKSLAASLAASQPAIFSGILKAQGGGGGTGTTGWDGTADPNGTTCMETTDWWETTEFPGTTVYETTTPQIEAEGEELDPLNPDNPGIAGCVYTDNYWAKAKVSISTPNPSGSVTITVAPAGAERGDGSNPPPPELVGSTRQITGKITTVNGTSIFETENDVSTVPTTLKVALQPSVFIGYPNAVIKITSIDILADSITMKGEVWIEYPIAGGWQQVSSTGHWIVRVKRVTK